MPANAPEYRLTPAARADLESIWLYTFETWGLEQAHDYVGSLTTAFTSLAEAPKQAMSCDDIRRGYRFFRSGRHVIYFKETEYGIAIVRVLHDRMLPTRHL